ncbi:aminotransferase class IV [Paenibacillus sp. NPDC058071]|uniref:aminotransferase class IV n=1 Tax=Paenibacillus sp. NPDC058071 TaxID=3346326 RepID=UPI0036D86735
MIIGINGSQTEAGKAVISVYDHGFLYGMGLFETFRTYDGEPYLLDRHLDRLAEGCAQLGIRYEPDERALRAQFAELLTANGLDDGYVRLTVSAGEGELGLPTGEYERPNELVLVKALPLYQEELYENGKQLRLLKTARNTPEGDVRLKSLHYMNNIIAKRELLASGAPAGAEGLMRTAGGRLAEGIVSNLFFVSEGVIKTPSIDTGILPGITRARVLELAQEAGYRTEEGHYSWEELLAADEVWMTTSVQELVPITTLADENGVVRTVGNGKIGEKTVRLLQAYREDTNRKR